jgi:hypothetical protein
VPDFLRILWCVEDAQTDSRTVSKSRNTIYCLTVSDDDDIADVVLRQLDVELGRGERV